MFDYASKKGYHKIDGKNFESWQFLEKSIKNDRS